MAQRQGDAAGVKASLQEPAAADNQTTHEHRPTTAAMLLAAVVLMTGIALRRWGAGQQ